MKIQRLIVLVLLLLSSQGAWATFSVVAVDRATGEMGSAGASCVRCSVLNLDGLSEVIKCSKTRRSLQTMVYPLSRAATPYWGI